MKCDVVLAGVGGQGILSVAAILAEAARRQGLFVKEAEVHGMAQRGGSVQATLRISPAPIASELIALGTAGMILGMEPVEALRQLDYLAPGGLVVTSGDVVADIPGYPPVTEIRERIRSLGGHLVDADRLAREAGSRRAANIVMLGAGSVSMTLAPSTIEACIREAFAAKGDRIVEIDLEAFRSGRAAMAPALR